MPQISSEKRKYKERIGDILLILALISAAVLMVEGLFLRIELIRQDDKNVALCDELDELKEQNKRLKIQYEASLDLTEIEEYAKNVLGMQKPNKGQMKEIDTETQNIQSDGDKGDISGKFEYWLSCIFKS